MKKFETANSQDALRWMMDHKGKILIDEYGNQLSHSLYSNTIEESLWGTDEDGIFEEYDFNRISYQTFLEAYDGNELTEF